LPGRPHLPFGREERSDGLVNKLDPPRDVGSKGSLQEGGQSILHQKKKRKKELGSVRKGNYNEVYERPRIKKRANCKFPSEIGGTNSCSDDKGYPPRTKEGDPKDPRRIN